RLVKGTRPGCYYAFISHRWLTRSHPDPHGDQARIVIRCLLGALCEAIRVAWHRGLLVPRRVVRGFDPPVGPSGSELAESLMVNVLRPTLTVDSLTQVTPEAIQIEEFVQDVAFGRAGSERSLTRLHSLLDRLPTFRLLLNNIHIWYD